MSGETQLNLAKRVSLIDSKPSLEIQEPKLRYTTYGNNATTLTDIYNDENNMVVWHRELSPVINHSVKEFLHEKPSFQTSMTVSPASALSSINGDLGSGSYSILGGDIAALVDMFCCLFDLKRAGLRLAALDRAMCPRFHVDKVPCRLITTYYGVATEWLPQNSADRTKLGKGSNGLDDNQSGLIKNSNDIQQLLCGDVALLKGERWEGNEGAGLIHRSPIVPAGERRLLLTLDFSD